MIPCLLLLLCALPLQAQLLSDQTAQSGIDFVQERGESGQRWFPETMGSGVAIVDLDGDGDLDLIFANGRPWDREGSGARVYRNRGNLRFEPDAQGLLPELYGMGVVAGDVDADGLVDLIFSGVEGLHLLPGRGADGFAEAQRLGEGWFTAISLLAESEDDALSIFAGRYVEWSPETDIWCSLDASTKSYCTPELYEATTPSLFVRQNGRWIDVAASRWGDVEGKVLGAVASDVDGDGWTDLVVANDTMPDLYLRATADGRYEDIGLFSGMALSMQGMARAGMGIDVADFAGDGRPGIAVGHFSGETLGLFRALRPDVFRDEVAPFGLSAPTLPELTFGLALVDIDLDGHCDLITANGHIESEIAKLRPSHRYRQPIGLYLQRERRFEAMPIGGEYVARGLAHGDLDDDGDPDFVLTQNGGPALLLRNERNPERWLRVELQGAWAAGAVVELQTNRRLLSARVHLGSSYLSCNAPQCCFALEDGEMPLSIRARAGAGRSLEKPIDVGDAPAWRITIP